MCTHATDVFKRSDLVRACMLCTRQGLCAHAERPRFEKRRTGADYGLMPIHHVRSQTPPPPRGGNWIIVYAKDDLPNSPSFVNGDGRAMRPESSAQSPDLGWQFRPKILDNKTGTAVLVVLGGGWVKRIHLHRTKSFEKRE